MSRSTDKVPLIIAVLEQNITTLERELDFAIVRKDWMMVLPLQVKITTTTELLGMVKALGIKKEKESTTNG